jgi:hypothetical protein
MNRWCDAKDAGVAGCQAPVTWVFKGADKKKYSCGRHLNNVALQMVAEGLEYMTLSVTDD